MFHSDKPIVSKGDDALNRAEFAKLLAKALIEHKDTETFTIGLFGKWGCGKTSLINMALSEIENIQAVNPNENEKVIIVRFEPWNFSDSNQLLMQFLTHLANEFGKKSDEIMTKIGAAIKRYSDAFNLLEYIPGVGGSIATIIKSGAEILANGLPENISERDVQEQKELVTRLLKEQSNRVLIVIDDIDRLTNEQIRYIFQLITSVAKFPNTTYLLIFDREIVVNALSAVQCGNGEDYLEKIIQMPIEIPNIQKEDLHAFLFTRLDSILKEFDDMVFSAEYWQSLFPTCVEPFIKHLRNVNRLCNALRFKLTAISAEINYTDMIAISIIEIHHPLVYEWIKENKSILTGENDFSALSGKEKKPEDWHNHYFPIFHELVQREFPELSVHEKKMRTETIINALSKLFPHFGRRIGKSYEVFDANKMIKACQIAHADKFNRYFELNVDKISTRRSDVTNIIYSLSECEIIDFLLQQDQKNSSYELLENVNARMVEITENRAEIIIFSLLKSICSLKQNVQKNLFSMRSGRYAEYMVLDLFERISQGRRKDFLVTILQNADAEIIQAVASVINLVELSYGRLSAEGTPRDFKRIITEDELLEIESIFVQQTQKILSSCSLFDLSEWRIVYHLLNAFEPEYTISYLEDALKNDIYVLHYLSSFVTVWCGAFKTYEIQTEYKDILTDDRIIKAIENCKQNGQLFELPPDIQHKIAAFYLSHSDAAMHKDTFGQADTKRLLDEWKK